MLQDRHGRPNAEASHGLGKYEVAEAAAYSQDPAASQTLKRWEQLAPYAAEFVGTALLTFTFVCMGLDQNVTWGKTAVGLAVVVLMYTFGHVSGGHFNPSVSLALWLSGRFRTWVLCGVISAQVLGATSAVWLRFCFRDTPPNFVPPTSSLPWAAPLIEIFFTMMLCFVYLSVAVSRRNNPATDPSSVVGLAIGCCVMAGGYASQAISDSMLNPAIAMGVQLLQVTRGADMEGWGFGFLFCEIVGTALAVTFYRLVYAEDSDHMDWLDGETPKALKISQKLSAEFLGTFFVVFTKGLCHLGGSPAEAWAVAAAYGAMVYSVRHISGAHLNPAVTLAVKASGRGLISVQDTISYWAAQFLGGCFAAAMFTLMHDIETFGVEREAGAPFYKIGLVEVSFTFALCYIMLTTNTVKPVDTVSRQNDTAGIAMGGCILVGDSGVGHISGGIMNPAMAFAITASHAFAGGQLRLVLVYCGFEAVGALLAAAVFFVTHIHVYTGRTPTLGLKIKA